MLKYDEIIKIQLQNFNRFKNGKNGFKMATSAKNGFKGFSGVFNIYLFSWCYRPMASFAILVKNGQKWLKNGHSGFSVDKSNISQTSVFRKTCKNQKRKNAVLAYVYLVQKTSC